MTYTCRKGFGYDNGFSCAYRMWKESSNRNLVHGYSLIFILTFIADTLDDKGLVYDLENTDWIQSYLEEAFDHTLAVVLEDPLMDTFMDLEEAGGCDLRYMEGVGAVKFAEMVWNDLSPIVLEQTGGRAKMSSVEVIEEGGDSSVYIPGIVSV